MASTDGEARSPLVSVPDDGLHVVGEFLGFRDERERTIGDRTFRGCQVGIRYRGGRIEAVSYGSRDQAERAVGGATVGSRIAVAVESKFGVKNGQPWQFLAGVGSAAGSDAFASQFTS